MKKFKFFSIIALVLFSFLSCSDDDDGPNLVPIEADQVTNLFAPITNPPGPPGPPAPDEGDFTKFDFATGAVTTSDTEWDIAFRSTAIIVNGGVSSGANDEPDRNGNAAAYFIDEPFQDVNEVNTSSFVQDSQASYAIIRQSDMGWYNYSGFNNNPPIPTVDNIIRPLAGRTLVFRTRDGKFAKVQILSYYQNNPNPINSFTDVPRYYTFNYVYQPNDGVTTFE
ncbi:MAG: hypothetical protein ED556_13890 [Winogradskyella sp.]|uniref:HmuY family protein n=1 Tax=Winogradskyella sp. TaxID=1883156 RepID=UPI000F415419|nr:HmuY family protein [Winogradskyella sp.]RNC80191.1 MAG: hypothetical protein ED556_13890 [Winogradskyella sp.]